MGWLRKLMGAPKVIFLEKELINHNSPDDSPDKSPIKFKKAKGYVKE